MISSKFSKSRPLKVALVANGDPFDPRTVSGVPQNLLSALGKEDCISVVAAINAKPTRLLRWLARIVTFHPIRLTWDQRYVHSRTLAWMRSLIRDRKLKSLSIRPDLVVHVRSWYYPIHGLAYASFLDATAEMLQGVSEQWTAPASVHERKVRVEGRFYRRASHVFSASSSGIASLTNEYRVDSEKVTKIGNGLNFDELPKHTSTNVSATDAPIVLFVGKESERKGLKELLLAFEGRDPSHDHAQLWIVGGPSERAIHNVRYIGLVESREKMQEIYEQAAIFCLPSRQESFGLVVPEAMSYGLPCIVTNTGELPELIGFGSAGVVVPVQDVESLRCALNTLLDSPELRVSMGGAGRELARNMTWTNVVGRMITALELDESFCPTIEPEIS